MISVSLPTLPLPPQSMEVILTGRIGAHAALPVVEGIRSESGYATIQSWPMGGNHVTLPVGTPGDVRLDSVQVRVFELFSCHSKRTQLNLTIK